MQSSAELKNCVKKYVYVFDSNYVYPFYVSLFSLVSNSKEQVSVVVASNLERLPEFFRKQIRIFASYLSIQIEFLEVHLPESLPTSKGFNTTTYSKLFMISQMEDVFVYLDVDTLVVKDVSQLWEPKNIPKTNNILSARVDPGILYSNSENRAIVDSGGRYFNAGVLIVNPTAWRLENLDSDVIKTLNSYYELGLEWLDQCVFNVILASRYLELPESFNCLVGLDEFSLSNTTILHFAGSHRKPWRIPIGFFHRLVYLRKKILDESLEAYRELEQSMFSLLKDKDVDFWRHVKSLRKEEFAKSLHLIDLIYYRFEMKSFGPVVKLIYGIYLRLKKKS